MARSALTLIELLVVITIISILGAGAIVSLTSTLPDRELREAARTLSAYLNAARARAAETNRPVGLMIRQYGGVSGFAFTLFLAEKPQPYCGDTTTSLMSVTSQGLSWFTTGDTGGGGLIRIGDTVQLNYQGGIYRITVGDTDANGYLLAGFPWTMTPVSAVPRNLPAGVPFRIYRHPRQSAVAPVQLPHGVVVDLFSSGIASNEFAPVDASPVIIMFSPDGSASRVYYSSDDIRPPSRIYLMIGHRENVTGVPSDPNANWRDPSSLWVSIAPFTGQVTTSENLATDPAILDPAVGLPLARALATPGVQIGAW